MLVVHQSCIPCRVFRPRYPALRAAPLPSIQSHPSPIIPPAVVQRDVPDRQDDLLPSSVSEAEPAGRSGSGADRGSPRSWIGGGLASVRQGARCLHPSEREWLLRDRMAPLMERERPTVYVSPRRRRVWCRRRLCILGRGRVPVGGGRWTRSWLGVHGVVEEDVPGWCCLADRGC